MSAKYEARKVRQKAKSKLRKQVQRLLRLNKWRTCCHSRLISWDCFCLRGCSACGVTHQCSECKTLYRPREILSLKSQTNEHTDQTSS